MFFSYDRPYTKRSNVIFQLVNVIFFFRTIHIPYRHIVPTRYSSDDDKFIMSYFHYFYVNITQN